MARPSANVNLITFFSNATSDEDSTAYNVPFNKGVFRVDGTFDGATVSFYSITPSANNIQLSDWSGNPINITTQTEGTLENILINERIYASISNAGSSTSLTVTLQRL